MEVDVAVKVDVEAEDADSALGPPQGGVEGVGALGVDDDGDIDVLTVVDGDFPPPANPFVGSSSDPAPTVLVKGYGFWPDRIIWA